MMQVIKFGSVLGNKILPEKIKEARVARGLSLAQLSKLVGVSSQAIDQYEKGVCTPSSAVMLKLVEALDFPVNFFSKTSRSKLKDELIYFRSNKNITMKLKESCKIRIKWIEDSYFMISDYINLPKVNIPNLGKIDIESIDLIDIEDIANKVRDYWNLGEYPISNLIDVLQQHGMVVTKLEIGSKKVDGFSIWKNEIPYIFVGSDKDSAVRLRFSIAHELGHLILHKDLTAEELESEKELIENQANMFAAAFLLPREEFNREMISSSIDSFILIKKKWKVSLSTMIKRAQDTGMLTENQIRYLNSQMIKYGYYRREPMDDEIVCEKPYLFKQAFEILVDNNIISKESLLETLGIKMEEAISLYSLRENFFEKPKDMLKLIK